LGSSSLFHLISGIRVGALRRRIWVDVYEGTYGAYRQELQHASSDLHAFKPDVLLLSLDANHLVAMQKSTVDQIVADITECWHLARESFACTVIQQTILPIFHPLLGNNEHRHGDSPLRRVALINERLRYAADDAGVHLLSIDSLAAIHGISLWHDEALWHRSKQEIHPRVTHLYGDHVARLLAAIRGQSFKCLVLDLDNTLWGGVVGDDGLGGIILGNGTAVGEAHLALQRYALSLSQRGVILAVCSKNHDVVAREVFDRHPEMLLKHQDISCFVANWDDKPSNLRHIAKSLNIGLDALVFVDDNPFERNLIRAELPQVAVPELSEDPADFAACVAAAGFFESVTITDEDRQRANQYRANTQRQEMLESVTDMDSYLRNLQMELRYRPFDSIGLQRIVQLANKTNQFNLTTRRYTDKEVQSIMNDPDALHLQLRLVDKFGDNGVISLIIGRLDADQNLIIETWLMSCRVLGRQVESATLNLLAQRALGMGAKRLVGVFRPTTRNDMVRDHYPKLGFEELRREPGETQWALDLSQFRETAVPVTIIEEA